nr:uncharacterized protein LOC129261103 [Lytechinus pictus]
MTPNHLEEGLQEMFEDMKRRLQGNPEVFEGPVKKMLKSYSKLKGNNSLTSAMSMFGRYNGINFAKRTCTSSKTKATDQSPLTSGPSIGVQPLSIARRKVKLGGRRSLTRGRPTKQAATQEHGYAKRSHSQSGIPKRARVAAPHSLSHATTMCQSLGKTHSSK